MSPEPDRSAQALETLMALGRALRDATSAPEVEQALARSAAQLLSARYAHFLRYEPGVDALWLTATVGGEPVAPDVFLPRGLGLSWQAAGGEGVLQIASDHIPPQAVRTSRGVPDMALLYVPLRTPHGALLGVLNVGRVAPDFDAWEVSLLGAYADAGSVALQRAQETQRHSATRDSALLALGLALEARDFETRGHTGRTVLLSSELGAALGLSDMESDALRQGAYLHDVGKLSMPDEVLLKPGPLTPEERRLIQEHVLIGEDIVRRIPGVAPGALGVVRSHHERWDGRGYPDGLRGAAIPLLARVFAVVDVYDALTHARPYRPAMSGPDALAHVHAEAGHHFDPQVVHAFLGLMREAPPVGGA